MTTVLPDDLFLHNPAFLRTRTRLQVVHLLLTGISEELSESSDVELCRDPNHICTTFDTVAVKCKFCRDKPKALKVVRQWLVEAALDSSQV